MEKRYSSHVLASKLVKDGELFDHDMHYRIFYIGK